MFLKKRATVLVMIFDIGIKNEEVHVEVKTTTSNFIDGFEMSRNEILASQNQNYKYKIFRIYSLDTRTCECKLKIYEGPVDNNYFILEPTVLTVYQKREK